MIVGVDGLAELLVLFPAFALFVPLALGLALLFRSGWPKNSGGKRKLPWLARTAFLAIALSPFPIAIALISMLPRPKQGPGWAVNYGTFDFRFDLRKERSFEALGIAAHARPSKNRREAGKRALFGGNIFIDAILSDALRYKGKASRVDAQAWTDGDSKLIESVVIVAEPMSSTDCGSIAGKSLSPAVPEAKTIALWAAGKGDRNWSYHFPPPRLPAVSIFLDRVESRCTMILKADWIL